jgi:alcohol dehydrogenase/propanol-preferring alcohol dehydrogenase
MISHRVEAFGRPLAQVLRDAPEPQGTEVLLKVGSCGVCHSDVHLHDGYFDLGDGAKIDMARPLALPRTLGHEIAGEVVALGPAATGLRVGERRVAYPWIGCGQCSLCADGREHLCGASRVLGVNRDGGFASHVLVPHPRYLLAFDGLAEEQACTYACAGVTAWSALKKAAPLAAGDALLVIGAGGVGLSGVRIARHLYGIAPIVAEVDAAKWDLARAAGAAEVIDPRDPAAARALVKASGGGVMAVVDFVGAAASFTFGLGALRKGGRLVSVGLIGGQAAVAPTMLAMKALTIQGSYVGSLDELREVLAVAQSGALPDLPLAPRPLAEANRALEELRAGRVRGRLVLKA